MLNQWIIDDAVETLTRAANQLHRVAEAIEKEAEGKSIGVPAYTANIPGALRRAAS